MRRRTQNQQREAQRSLPACELLPSATISTLVKLHASPYSPKTLKKGHESKPMPEEAIELHPEQPGRVTFHHRQKMASFEFRFDHVFDKTARAARVANTLGLARSLLQENRDACMIAMGGEESGLEEFCGGSEGLLFSLLSELWDQLQSLKAAGEREGAGGVNSVRLAVKMVAVEEERLFDMLSPKSEAAVKDAGSRIALASTAFPVLSVYDLLAKLEEVYHQRKLLYPDSVAVFEAELTVSRETYLIAEEAVSTRFFTFLQWPRGSSSRPRAHSHNNQSLLMLNMCVYELYKTSCHSPERVSQAEASQLWAHFRNSHLAMLLKRYFQGGNRVAFLGCLAQDRRCEDENYQVLMLAKNLGKIDLKKFREYSTGLIHTPLDQAVKTRKMRTEPVDLSRDSGKGSPTPSPSPGLRKLKENLQRILKEKESSEAKREQEEGLALLFKERKQCQRELEDIRYKREEIRIREDYGNPATHSRIIAHDLLPPLLQKRRSRPSEDELARLTGEEEAVLRRINALQAQIIGSASGELKRRALEMEVRLQEREMIDTVANKSRILALLKGQLREMRVQDSPEGQERPQSKSRKQRYKESRSDQTPSLITLEVEQTEPIYNNPEGEQAEELPSATPEPKQGFRLETLKKLNKNNYLFEKRRLVLKAKLSKGREEINRFYEQAAQKFQEYKPK